MNVRFFRYRARALALGWTLFALAGFAAMLSRHHPAWHPDLADGILGFLYGVSFGCIIVGYFVSCVQSRSL